MADSTIVVAVERDARHNFERRRLFCALARAVRERRIVFIDESFRKTGMCRQSVVRTFRGCNGPSAFPRCPEGCHLVDPRPSRELSAEA